MKKVSCHRLCCVEYNMIHSPSTRLLCSKEKKTTHFGVFKVGIWSSMCAFCCFESAEGFTVHHPESSLSSAKRKPLSPPACTADRPSGWRQALPCLSLAKYQGNRRLASPPSLQPSRLDKQSSERMPTVIVSLNLRPFFIMVCLFSAALFFLYRVSPTSLFSIPNGLS